MLAIIVYWGADLLVRVLPPRVADSIGVGLARLAFVSGLKSRRALEENLSRLMEAAPRRTIRERARESFVNFARMFTDFLRLGRLGRERLASSIDVHGAEHLEAALGSGRGVILLSAHLGNWEMGAAYIASLGTRMNVVARPHGNRWVERFFARRRHAWGVEMLPGRPLWKDAAGALRRREWVALMADREAHAGQSTGRRGGACAWAAALSRRTGALVLPAVIVRLPGRRYAAHFERPLTPENVTQENHFEVIRSYLRRYPGQWFAFEPLPRGLA
jgi:KDO2-lipid IV(A) lauroyltransferase